MTDDTPTEGSALVWIKVMAMKLATSHTADGMNEVGPVQIFEPVLVQIMSVGTTVEVVRRRILAALLITCILRPNQYTCNEELKRTYAVTFLVKHEGSDGPPSVSTVPCLTTNPNGGTTPSVLVLGPGNRASRHRHGRVSVG